MYVFAHIKKPLAGDYLARGIIAIYMYGQCGLQHRIKKEIFYVENLGLDHPFHEFHLWLVGARKSRSL